jgi:hypothetical protein
MGVTSRMNANTPSVRDNVTDKLYREERNFRADKLVEKWARIPEVGKNIKNLQESDARNLAIHLENQARFMSRLTETQMSQGFQGLSPENMLRLVRLAYPNTIRNKIFTEFAMESAKDSIKYIRPVYTNTQWGNDMNTRTFGVGGLDSAVDSGDPWNVSGQAELQNPDYRRAMYETTEDRYVHELANGVVGALVSGDTIMIGKTNITIPATVTVAGNSIAVASGVFVYYGQREVVTPAAGAQAEFANLGYLDGYAAIFGTTGERDPIAVQAKTGANLSNTGEWLIKNGLDISITTVAPGVYFLYNVAGNGVGDIADVVKCYGRFNSEGDFTGDYLGEVELIMTDYWFRPRPTSIGVTWSQLTELVLDTSFGVSAEELLVDYAGQEIKKALDFRAVKIAYQAAALNPGKYTVHFNAASGDTTDDSYLHTAQTFSQAIERVGDTMFNDILRGGVSRIVGGPAAVSYLRLNSGFTTKGAQPRVGGHQVGEIYGIPVFKVPSSVVPDNQLLCIWKNDENEADVSIAFGTLVPFFSTGIIQRKNFYKEAALATYGDWAILNKRYIGRIQIDNIRTVTGSNAYDNIVV